MGYMVALLHYPVHSRRIHLSFVKFVRKKLDEARDRRFQKEHQVNPMAETAKEKPDEK